MPLLGSMRYPINNTNINISQTGMVYGRHTLRLIDQDGSSEFRDEAMAINISEGWLIKGKNTIKTTVRSYTGAGRPSPGSVLTQAILDRAAHTNL